MLKFLAMLLNAALSATESYKAKCPKCGSQLKRKTELGMDCETIGYGSVYRYSSNFPGVYTAEEKMKCEK